MSYGQSLDDANVGQSRNIGINIEISEPQNHGVGSKRYTDYLVKTKVSIITRSYNYSNCIHHF
jgi:hypothetical protein